jgi:GIY-YIG catalytic domain
LGAVAVVFIILNKIHYNNIQKMKQQSIFDFFFEDLLAKKLLIYSKLKNLQGIYILRNKIYNRIYIGSSVTLDRRIACYINNDKNVTEVIKAAIDKYGIENFSLTVIVFPDVSREVLFLLETILIQTFKPEYNVLKEAGTLPYGEEHPKYNSGKPIYLYKLTNDGQLESISDSQLELVETFANGRRASEELGISKSAISRYLKSDQLLFSQVPPPKSIRTGPVSGEIKNPKYVGYFKISLKKL